MITTVEAVIDENGKVELLESISLPRARRALLTILDDEPKRTHAPSSRELLKALDDAYSGDADEEEKEFLRLAKIKQTRVLDEWK